MYVSYLFNYSFYALLLRQREETSLSMSKETNTKLVDDKNLSICNSSLEVLSSVNFKITYRKELNHSAMIMNTCGSISYTKSSEEKQRMLDNKKCRF